jgi:hypothetical protein
LNRPIAVTLYTPDLDDGTQPRQDGGRSVGIAVLARGGAHSVPDDAVVSYVLAS